MIRYFVLSLQHAILFSNTEQVCIFTATDGQKKVSDACHHKMSKLHQEQMWPTPERNRSLLSHIIQSFVICDDIICPTRPHDIEDRESCMRITKSLGDESPEVFSVSKYGNSPAFQVGLRGLKDFDN